MDRIKVYERLSLALKATEKQYLVDEKAYTDDYVAKRSITHRKPSYEEHDEETYNRLNKEFWAAFIPYREPPNRLDFACAFFCFQFTLVIDRDDARFCHCVHDCVEAHAVCLSVWDGKTYAEHVTALRNEKCLFPDVKRSKTPPEELDYWATYIIREYHKLSN